MMHGSSEEIRRRRWAFASLAAGLLGAAAVIVVACEPITHANDFGTSAPDGGVVTMTGCPTGQTLCSGDAGQVCTDPTSDRSNCGGCGNVCGNTYDCTNSACACPSGQTVCNGQCTDFSQDPASCGGCGTQFSCGANGACDNGTCRLFCPEGQTNCNDELCTDLQSDPQNCDTCNHDCGRNYTCDAGLCFVCPAVELCPDPAGGSDICTALGRDPANCGSCAHTCLTNEVCTVGMCACKFPDLLCAPTGGPVLPGGESVCTPQSATRCGPLCVDCSTLGATTPYCRSSGAGTQLKWSCTYGGGGSTSDAGVGGKGDGGA